MNSDFIRSQSRSFPAGPEMTLYTALIIASAELTSAGLAAGCGAIAVGCCCGAGTAPGAGVDLWATACPSTNQITLNTSAACKNTNFFMLPPAESYRVFGLKHDAGASAKSRSRLLAFTGRSVKN